MESNKGDLGSSTISMVVSASKNIVKEAVSLYFRPLKIFTFSIANLFKHAAANSVDYDKVFLEKHSYSLSNILISTMRLFRANSVVFPIDEMVLAEAKKLITKRKKEVDVSYSRLDSLDKPDIDLLILRQLLQNSLKYAGENSDNDERIKILITNSKEEFKFEILFKESEISLSKERLINQDLLTRYAKTILERQGGHIELFKSISMALSIMAIIVPSIPSNKHFEEHSQLNEK
jgi:hypothetical protein